MKAELPIKTLATGLDDILHSAVVLNWETLAIQSLSASVRIEYHVGMDGAVDFLKLWACGREYWSLICDYSPHRVWSDGSHFSNGYLSHSLGRLLQSIIMNRNRFRHDCRPNSNGTLEIRIPQSKIPATRRS